MKKYALVLLSSLLTSSTLLAVVLSPNTDNNTLIVYNSNIGLVHETRSLALKKNDTQIIYSDVASSINTDSVHVSLPPSVTLYSQQYRYDKLTQNKLLRAHIGKTIEARIPKGDKSFRTVFAKLLSHDGASCIVQHKNKIIIVASKDIIFSRIPSELLTKPSLLWNVKASKTIHTPIDIDYLIANIRWSSNYTLQVHEDTADLTGWIHIDNRSGKAFNKTSLYLVAGDINRVHTPRPNYKKHVKMAQILDSAPEVSHQSHEGYHLYRVPFKVTLANKESTQLQFIQENSIDIQREYTVRTRMPRYLHGYLKHGVSQHITIKGFDFVLPKGVVRSYSKVNNTSILLGESSLAHTAKNTPISLTLGKNFDLSVEETLLKRDKGSWSEDTDIRYSVKNASDTTKRVRIQVPFTNNKHDTIESKKRYKMIQGNIVEFTVDVKANTSQSFRVFYTNKIK